MLSPQDKKEIGNMIATALSDFKTKNLSFRQRKTADQAVDVHQAATIGDLTGYVPKSGGALADGANIAVGSTIGTEIATAPTQKLGFWGATPVIRQTVTGSQSGGAALASLLTKLALEGLIVDSTTP